jgi:hypothetical protein
MVYCTDISESIRRDIYSYHSLAYLWYTKIKQLKTIFDAPARKNAYAQKSPNFQNLIRFAKHKLSKPFPIKTSMQYELTKQFLQKH